MLKLVLQRLEYFYLSLKWGKSQELEDNYLSSLMNYNKIGEDLVGEDSQIEGVIISVRNNGFLEVEIDKEIKSFQFKEIQFVL